MTSFLTNISLLFIPAIITTILLFGFIKKAPIYDLFIEGVKDGLSASVEMLPFIISIFIGIESLTSSGAMTFLEGIFAPIFKILHIPEQLISMILLRPVSGSGSLILAEKIMKENGPDSFVGCTACTMVGSCETVFYVLALYFGVTAVKNMRHSLSAGVLGYVAGIIASIIFSHIFC